MGELKELQMPRMVEEVDSWMEHIWLDVVKREYDRGRILKESNLHSTSYLFIIKRPVSNWP